MTAPTRYPSEYAAFRRQVRVATIRLGQSSQQIDITRLETKVADCAESFAATVGLVDGTRSGQITLWSRLLTRVAVQVSRESAEDVAA